MVKNTGKPSEQTFDDYWKQFGKDAKVIAFDDASTLFAKNNRRVVDTNPQPSDRIVVFKGDTFFAEIKSSTHESRFNFSLLRKTQSAIAAMILAAGGQYDVFFHSLPTDRWYRIPYSMIRTHKDRGAASIPIVALEPFAWSMTRA